MFSACIPYLLGCTCTLCGKKSVYHAPLKPHTVSIRLIHLVALRRVLQTCRTCSAAHTHRPSGEGSCSLRLHPGISRGSPRRRAWRSAPGSLRCCISALRTRCPSSCSGDMGAMTLPGFSVCGFASSSGQPMLVCPVRFQILGWVRATCGL